MYTQLRWRIQLGAAVAAARDRRGYHSRGCDPLRGVQPCQVALQLAASAALGGLHDAAQGTGRVWVPGSSCGLPVWARLCSEGQQLRSLSLREPWGGEWWFFLQSSTDLLSAYPLMVEECQIEMWQLV